MKTSSDIANGIVWTGVEKAFEQAVGFAQGVILARLLCPDDFGLTAMLGVFLLLGNAMSDCGLGNTLIAFGERFRTSGTLALIERRAVAFNVGIGLAVYAVLAVAAPGIAAFYGRAELRDLVWIMGATVPLNAACVVWNARLNRDMRFGLLSRINMGVTLTTFMLGIALASAGCGVWSIAWMNVAWAAARILVFARAARGDAPGAAVPVSPGTVPGDFRLCLSHGWRLMVSELLGTLYGSSYHFVLGKLFGAASAGIFARGHRWSQLAGDVVNQSFGRVSLSAFARGDGGAMRYIAFNVAIVWPCLVVLGVFAEEIVGFVLGDQWLPCVAYLRILLVGAAFMPVTAILLNVLKAAGRSDLVLKGEAVKRPVAFLSIIAAVIVLTCGRDAFPQIADWDGVAVFCWVKAANDAFEALVSALLVRRFRADSAAGARESVRPTAFFPWKIWREVKLAQPDYRFLSYREIDVGVKAGTVFLWGNKEDGYRRWALEIAARDGSEIVYCEDGFVKSADTWANRTAPLRYRRGCSVIFDRKGYYFDGTRETEIEAMLNDATLEVSADERATARRLMKRLVDEKITKYNHQPLTAPAFGRPGRRKVLVVDQSAGDASIRLGMADENTFKAMLEDAVRENPEADVLVKTHPDTLARACGGYYGQVAGREGLYRVTDPVNPYALLDQVDKVYVCSTQMGFEALLAGKEVHVYGMPFYAGWGVTVDRLSNPRRTRRRDLEELFAIFYLRYTKWVDPVAQRACSMDEALDRILSLRREYRWTRHFNFIRKFTLLILTRPKS